MGGTTIREGVSLKVSRATQNGERMVQVVRHEVDPFHTVPVGDPVVVGPDESLELDVSVGVGEMTEPGDVELEDWRKEGDD